MPSSHLNPAMIVTASPLGSRPFGFGAIIRRHLHQVNNPRPRLYLAGSETDATGGEVQLAVESEPGPAAAATIAARSLVTLRNIHAVSSGVRMAVTITDAATWTVAAGAIPA